MVKYAGTKYPVDTNRTFVTGTSSGAMMTQVLLGAYPEVFKAGSAYSGVPDGCFAVPGSTATTEPPGWSNNCANGQVTKSAKEWGDLTRSYYPEYKGPRPRVQMYVSATTLERESQATLLTMIQLARNKRQHSQISQLLV